MKITIKRMDNGAVVLWNEEGAEGEVVEHGMVFEFDDEENPGRLADMLSEITELIGYCPNKWRKENVYAIVGHGQDYECGEKKCEICEKE